MVFVLFLKYVYRLRPNNHCIIMKHLRTFWFIICYGKNEFWDIVLFCWSDEPLTCQCSTTSLIDLTISLRRFIRVVKKTIFPQVKLCWNWNLKLHYSLLNNRWLIWRIDKQQATLLCKTWFTNLKTFNQWNVQADWNMCFNLMCQYAGYV